MDSFFIRHKMTRNTGEISLSSKLFYQLLLLVFLLPLTLHAQQFKLEQTEALISESWSSTTFKSMSYLHFNDSLNGVVLIDSVWFGVTTDGGITWKNRRTLVGQSRTADVIMFSKDSLFYISVNKRIIFSSDGGSNWSDLVTAQGITGQIASMIFYNRLHGIIATTSGELFRTIDGGYTWTVVPGFSAGTNTRLEVYGNYTIGYKSTSGFILSSDMGDTWQLITLSTLIQDPNHMKIMNGKLYISTIAAWYYITDLTGQILYREYAGSAINTNKFAFPSENEVWAGEGSTGLVKVSVPGSGVWVQSSFPMDDMEVTGVHESFNGQILVEGAIGTKNFAMMMVGNPSSRFSVKNARLPGNYRLSSVKIVNPRLILVGSFDGYIFRSTDKGVSWLNTTNGQLYPAITDITFKDSNFIFASCTGGILLKSTDGGLNWASVSTNIKEKITGVEFKRTDSLFITTEKMGYVTTLSNLSTFQPLNNSFTYAERMYKIKFWDKHKGYIGAENQSYYTTNGGKSWQDYGASYYSTVNTSRIQGFVSYELTSQAWVKIGYSDYTLDAEPHFITFFKLLDHDLNSGFMLDNYLGAVLAIYPGESRFEYFKAGGPRSLLAFDYYDTDLSVGVGENGEMIFLSHKAAEVTPMLSYALTPADTTYIHGRDVEFSWKEPSILIPNDEYRIEIAKGDTGSIMISQAGISSTQFQVYGLDEESYYFWRVSGRNSNGWGEFTPWTRFFLSREIYSFDEYSLPVDATINSLAEGSNGIVWAAGNGGFVAKSTTFGVSWEVVPVQFLDDIKSCFVNPSTNAIFLSTSTGDLLSTFDGGISWQRSLPLLPGSVVTSMTFSTDSEGYLCGLNGLVARSSDGGSTWWIASVPVTGSNFNSIHYAGAGTVLVAADGGLLLRSSDNGRHYDANEIFSGDDYKALFSFKERLYLINQFGSAKTSTDVGFTWKEQTLNFGGFPVAVDASKPRYNLLSNNNKLYTSTREGNALSNLTIPGSNLKRVVFMTSSGNLILAGTGSTILIGKDTSTVYNSIGDFVHSSNPDDFRLFQNYPNPFNGSTIIHFTLPADSDCRLEIFTPLGSRIIYKELMGKQGINSYHLDASELHSGVYFYRVTAAGQSKTGKMILLK